MARASKVPEKNRLTAFFTKQTSVLLLILALAAFLRIYNLTVTPPGFHRDEALFGYEAYSIAQTGRDQHGRFLPLSFEGFGVIDYPLVIYLRVPFIAIMGLDVFSVRFSLVFYSLITIFLIYKLAQKLFNDQATAFIAALVAAFSSWHFFMSRSGYAIAVIGLMFLLLGVYLMLYGRRRRQNVAGGIALGLTCFSYASYYFFTPVFLMAILAIFLPEIKKDKDIRFGFIAAVLTTALAFGLFWNVNIKRAPQSAFYLDHRNIEYGWADKPVGEILAQGRKYDFVERWLHDPRTGYFYKGVQNYFDGFSTSFWLKTGRGFESNVDGFGNLLLYEPVLIAIGAFYLLWKKSKAGLFLVAWIVLGPISSTFTRDVVSTRILHMVVPFVLLQAVALKFLVKDVIFKLRPKIIAVVLVLAFFAPLFYFNLLYFDAYFRHMNAYAGRWWQKGFLDVVDMTNRYPEKQVYFKGKWGFAYIMFAFRNKYDPATFQKEAKREISSINFNTVTDFGRYHFIDDITPDMICRDYNSIYIEELQQDHDPSFKTDGVITSLGSDRFVYFVPDAEKCASL